MENMAFTTRDNGQTNHWTISQCNPNGMYTVSNTETGHVVGIVITGTTSHNLSYTTGYAPMFDTQGMETPGLRQVAREHRADPLNIKDVARAIVKYQASKENH